MGWRGSFPKIAIAGHWSTDDEQWFLDDLLGLFLFYFPLTHEFSLFCPSNSLHCPTIGQEYLCEREAVWYVAAYRG